MTKENVLRNEQVKADFMAGIRPGHIARKYGITRQRIYQICAGVEVEPAQAYPAEVYSDNPRRDVSALGIEIVNMEDVKNV